MALSSTKVPQTKSGAVANRKEYGREGWEVEPSSRQVMSQVQ